MKTLYKILPYMLTYKMQAMRGVQAFYFLSTNVYGLMNYGILLMYRILRVVLSLGIAASFLPAIPVKPAGFAPVQAGKCNNGIIKI
jgi:hypothetical protein